MANQVNNYVCTIIDSKIEYTISYRNTLFENKRSIMYVSILGIPGTAALIVPNVLLYLILPTICKSFPKKFKHL